MARRKGEMVNGNLRELTYLGIWILVCIAAGTIGGLLAVHFA